MDKKVIQILGYNYEVSLLENGRWHRYYLAGDNVVFSQWEDKYHPPVEYYMYSKNEIRTK